jgi:type I restriction enzyme, S subunit
MMNSYPKYKDSGIEWIKEIPSEWQLTKLKHVVTKIGSGVTPKGGSEAYQESGIPLLRSQNIHFDGLRLDDVAFISEEIHDDMSNSKVKSGDVLLNITGASIGRCFYWPVGNQEANVNQHVCIIRPSEKVKTRFIYNFLCSGLGQFQIDYCQNGANREGLSNEQLGGFFFPLPSLHEQKAIAAYLDDKTSKIDRLLQAKRREIELLKEERTALINQAVTRGLDPDVPLKDSGMEWIGMIPKHWEVKRVSLFSRLSSGFAFKSEAFSFEIGVRLVRGDNVTEGNLRWGDKARFWPEITEDLKPFLLEEGDIVIGMDGSKVGKNVARIEASDTPLLLVQRVARIAAQVGYSEWLFLWFRTYIFQNHINVSKSDPAIPHITLRDIGSFVVTYPPIEETRKLITDLNRMLEILDTTTSKIEKEIDLLQEYRTALISEVVTGKVKITN